ncbi:retrovirus-related Pol polyprotein from transposon opus [Trichonephila clavipes]|nr:retrovirus-related Pol polyprotein from transposon opus [Trichonephila clavipes]
MVVDTGANVSIISKDLAQNSKVSIIWTPPRVSLQTVTNDKVQVHGKANVTLRTESIIAGLVAENRKYRFGLIDYPDPDNSKEGVLIASSVVDLSKSVIPVRVANISDKTRLIQEGELIAACAPVASVDRKCNSQDLSSENLVKDLLQNTDLDERQRCGAGGLIKEFQSLFSRTSEDFGRTRLTKHQIDTEEHPSIKQHPRRLSFAKQEEVQKLINDMKDNDVIKPSSSPWASLIVLVKKKEGSTRFCVDYRRLNDVTKKYSFPLSRIDDTLNTLAGKIPGFLLKISRREVVYLGHIISAEGVRADPDKISAVIDWNCPTDVPQLRSFLGLYTYYRKVVKNFSTIAKPLHKLIKAKKKFLWTVDCNNAFNKLKDALTSASILAYPEIGKQFILGTDASHESIGAVLSQGIDGQERVIAYFSKCLSKPERNY